MSFIHSFRTFNTNTNTIQTRISKEFSKALTGDDSPLATHYGALSGLGEMGVDVSVIITKVLNHKFLVAQCGRLCGELFISYVELFISENIEGILQLFDESFCYMDIF